MGKGSVQFDSATQRYLIDLAITANYDSIALGHCLRWRRSFEFASSLLFTATNGQMQLGAVYFVNAGTSTGDEDIILQNLIGDCTTSLIQLKPFCGRITLMLHVMNEPLVAVHEIGHYVATLGDEYFGTLRVCQNDPSTKQCIMEFGRDFGLRLDDSGEVAMVQPNFAVSQFCFCGHPHVPAPSPTNNGQQYRHRQSCWETLKKFYPLLTLPSGTSIVNTLQPMQWNELSTISRYAIAIPVEPGLAANPVEQAIKNAVKEWVNRIAATGDQLALVMGSRGTIRPMQAIPLAEVKQWHQLIDATSLTEGESQPIDFQNAISEFDGNMTAYQRLLLLATGNSRSDTGGLPTALAGRRVALVATTVGAGEFVDQLDELRDSSKWVAQQNFAIADTDLPKYSFSLQNELIESYFDNSPGSGIVNLRWGSLPATQSAEFAGSLGKGEANQSEGELQLWLQLGADGIDFPVWVEQDARSLSFLLSEPEVSNIDLTLIAPDETAISVPSRPDTPIHAFDRMKDVSGRWIIRLRRTKAGPRLPFFFIAAVNNRELRVSAHVNVSPTRHAQFLLQAIHTFPIDYVNAAVDILKLEPDENNLGEIYSSVPLRRDRALIPATQFKTEVSSGLYRGEIQLEPGSYVAVFRAHNYGQAIYASNSDGVVGGNIVGYKQKPIPSFARVVRQRFRIK